MKSIIAILISGAFTLGLTACQTDNLKQYDQLQVGMDKDDVLGVMGSPQRTDRWHGKDRWRYRFYSDRKRYDKEIRFEDGVAEYVGENYKPQVSAEEQDRLNEASNNELQARYEAEALRAREDQRHYLYPDENSNVIRYVPQFKPVD